jgi:hypothetical protein|tara:strand:+ start:1828 stop:2040 length:213 start_codon:yes stop_codon:yes gene_type:complete
MTSKEVANRRYRAAVLREKKKDAQFMEELTTKTNNDTTQFFPVNNKINQTKIKRTRMQNAIGTSGMFIKP